MEFISATFGFFVGMILALILVGGSCLYLYFKAMRKLQALQVDFAAKATTLIKEQVVDTTFQMAKGYLSRKGKPAPEKP